MNAAPPSVLPRFGIDLASLIGGLAGEPWAWIGAGGIVVVLLFWVSAILENSTGLSSGAEVLASDTGQNRVELIRDPYTGLVGKPDYVLLERVFFRKKMVPVELKPTRRSKTLYYGDMMQLVTYMVLLRSEYGSRFAGYGKVRYKEATFTVKLTRALERELQSHAGAVRDARQADYVERNHDERVKCARCPLRTVCAESLA